MDDFIAQLNLASMDINVRHDNVPDIEVTKSILAAFQAAGSAIVALQMCEDRFDMTK